MSELPIIGKPVFDVIRASSGDGEEVVRIAHDGRIYWHGRQVETDEDFRAAMLELKAALMPMTGRQA